MPDIGGVSGGKTRGFYRLRGSVQIMLLINCPYCGERPEPEFVNGGQAHLVRPRRPAEISTQEWTDYLYRRDNTRGVHAERWRHTHGCGRFFNALRDTTTDQFLATYKVGEPRPDAAPAADEVSR